MGPMPCTGPIIVYIMEFFEEKLTIWSFAQRNSFLNFANEISEV